MKVVRTVCGIMATIGFTAASFAQAPSLENMDLVLKSVPNGPVALVNGQPIEPATFKDLYMGEIVHFTQTHPKDQIGEDIRLGIALNCLRSLIEHEILYQEAVHRKITITDDKLNEAWSKWIEGLEKAITKPGEPAPSEADVLKRAGLTRDAGLAELRKRLMIDEVQSQIVAAKGVTVSDDEVSKWYNSNKDRTKVPERIHLKQIFIKADSPKAQVRGPQQPSAEQRAKDAYNRIASGQSFESVCKAVSDGQYKDNGGDWGEQPMSQLQTYAPFLVDAANKLKPGEVSQPIKSELGYHILKLVDTLPGEDISLDKAAPEVKKMLLQLKGIDAVHEFTSQTTKDSSKVQVFLDLEKQLRTRPELLEKFAQEFKAEQAQAPKKDASAPKKTVSTTPAPKQDLKAAPPKAPVPKKTVRKPKT